MTAAMLYVSIACDTVSDAQKQLRHFVNAGLDPDHPRVHVSIGEYSEPRDAD